MFDNLDEALSPPEGTPEVPAWWRHCHVESGEWLPDSLTVAARCPACGDNQEFPDGYGLNRWPCCSGMVWLRSPTVEEDEAALATPPDEAICWSVVPRPPEPTPPPPGVPAATAHPGTVPGTLLFDCPHCAHAVDDIGADYGEMSFREFLTRFQVATHEISGDYGLNHCPITGKPIWLQEYAPMPPTPSAPAPTSNYDNQRSGRWTDYLQRTGGKNATPLGNTRNVLTAFRYSPEFRGVLAFNSFTQTAEVLARWPWQKESEPFEPHTLSDQEVTEVQSWLQGWDIQASAQNTLYALIAAAHDAEHHPVQDYLSALRWDGERRLDAWLAEHLGAADTPYSRAVGCRFLVGMVARIYKPGCKNDCALVLEGPQGIGKSQVLDVLGGQWFTDYLPADLGSKDAMQQLNGSWLVELAEMHSFRASDVDRVKRYMSAREDKYRPPYGRAPVKIPRQTVFAGTINPNGAGYLRDETGDRRWWPVECAVGWQKGRKIDVKRFRRVRDQLLAEAVHRWRAGAVWWLDSGELEQQAQQETDQRYDDDVWSGEVLRYAGRKAAVTTVDVLQHALGMTLRDCDVKAQRRVAKVLRKAGWTRQQVRKGENWKDREWQYANPNPPDESAVDDNVVGFPGRESPLGGLF